MINLSRTLTKTLLRQVKLLQQQATKPRLRAPLITGFWGQGGKIPSRTVADRICAAFPNFNSSDEEEDSSSQLKHILTEHVEPFINPNTLDQDVDDFKVLRQTLLSILRSRVLPPSRSTLDEWIEQGFDAYRAMRNQQDYWLGSSISQTNGLYVDVTSSFHGYRSDTSMFAYSVYIENQSEHTLQILGRKWKIMNLNTPNSIIEVNQLEQGIVGKQPKLQPGEAFYYVSGTELESGSDGIMSGELFVRKYPTEKDLLENEDAMEEHFLFDISPFNLVAPDESRAES
jgi:ApaG protein